MTHCIGGNVGNDITQGLEQPQTALSYIERMRRIEEDLAMVIMYATTLTALPLLPPP